MVLINHKKEDNFPALPKPTRQPFPKGKGANGEEMLKTRRALMTNEARRVDRHDE
jgi:hypothetical protein